MYFEIAKFLGCTALIVFSLAVITFCLYWLWLVFRAIQAIQKSEKAIKELHRALSVKVDFDGCEIVSFDENKNLN